MRAVWCCLVVLFLLAPAGTVGITAAPSDAETELTSPRAGASVSVARRIVDDPVPLAVVAGIAPRLLVVRRAEWLPRHATPTAPLETRHVAVIGQRGPPA